MKQIFAKKNVCRLLLVAMLASFSACNDTDEQTELSSAIYPSSIEMLLPDELQELVYVDHSTNISVLPLLKGEKISLDYKMLPENVTFNEAKWSSTDESVATVEADGDVEALKAGYAVLQVAPVVAYSGSGVNSTLRLAVVDELVKAEAITLTSPASELFESESIQLSATIAPENATYKTVRWSSSDETIATVNNQGVVTGVSAPGTQAKVTITATALDGSGVSASREITVIKMVQPQSITLDQTYAKDNGYECAIADKTIKLTYTTVPENSTASVIQWASSNEDIATVDNGVVTFNQKGAFGDVVITATCPETGNSSSITLNLAEGLVRELFHNKDNYSWYNAKQSANGTSSSHKWTYGKLAVTTFTVNATTQRADFKCWSPKTWLHAGKYPIFAIRMDDVKDKYAGQVTGRNINIDASGSCNGKDFKGSLGGNNAWEHDYKCSDDSHVFIYNLAAQKFQTGGILPTTSVAAFKTFQFKYADMKPIDHQIEYNVYWVQTFKTLDDLQRYIQSEGLTYEIIK